MYPSIFIFPLIFISCYGLFEDDECVINGSPGICVSFSRCRYARRILRSNRGDPQTCGFIGKVPLVCCPTPLEISFFGGSSISEEKCNEYHDIRNRRISVARGQKARVMEFPHMAALGYGANKFDQIFWNCGGTLISENFVLTAAHCTHTLDFGDPKLVRLGELNFNDTNNGSDPQDIEILSLHPHPDYKPPSHYHDIALIKLKKSAKFNLFVKPACIHTRKNLPFSQIQAIGWGKTDFLGEGSDHLMKVFLHVIEHEKCSEMYRGVSSRRLSGGIKEETQICAGDSSGGDTCPGDSGGPLHFKQEGTGLVFSRFVVVGVTSFGKACGIENSAGVYTRVSAYRSWIEDTVWPIK